MESKILATDLDGTLLHPEPEAIPVLGRSGYRYMSEKSATLLAEISKSLPVAIATGRNSQSVRRLVCQLDDMNFCGFVMENGLVSRTNLRNDIASMHDEWREVANLLPEWERLAGYEKCLGMIFPPSEKYPKAAMGEALSRTGKADYLLYQERHKIFAYPFFPSKLSGVRSLGFDPFIVLGDEMNDLDMLRASSHPGTLSTARDAVRQCIWEKNGYCSALSSHAATEDLLTWTLDVIAKTL